MKKLCLFVLSMAFVVSAAVAAGLPYVAAVLPDGTSVLLSYAAANAYRKDESVVKKLVPGTIQGQKVLMLPSEQHPVPTARQDSVSRNADRLAQAIQQQASCGGNMDCEYLVKFWTNVEGWSKQQVDNYMASSKNLNYAVSLHNVKKACFNNTRCAIRNLIVLEKEHMDQIVGSNRDYKALRKAISEKPARFTMVGLNQYLTYLCNSTKDKKEIKKLSTFADDIQKDLDNDKSLVIRGKPMDSIAPAMSCIAQKKS